MKLVDVTGWSALLVYWKSQLKPEDVTALKRKKGPWSLGHGPEGVGCRIEGPPRMPITDGLGAYVMIKKHTHCKIYTVHYGLLDDS